jgi:DNA polymerase-3 subunit epsilon
MQALTPAFTLRAAALRGPVACVDLETTGGMSAHHRIIEVGIVLLDHGVIVEEWNTLLQPGIPIPPAIASFTGIDDAMVANAPRFEDVRREIRQRLDGRLFVAHNARFDYGFLRTEFRRLGEPFSAPVLCTVRLSRALYAEHRRHNLDTLIERFGLTCTARHRALGDAQVLPALLAAIEDERGDEVLQGAVTTALHETRLPAHLPAGLADDLPDSPGVYVFRDASGELLYVGKSRNIRSRVFEHFATARRPGQESRLAPQVRQVEWTETGGELGALLLEARMIRELSPSMNRRVRRTDTDCVVRLVATETGLRPEVVPLDAEAFTDEAPVHGPFHSAKDAWRAIEGKAREAALCLKLLGREQGPGSCVAYQLGKCRGACLGKEPRALHDARLQLALVSLRVREWPFDGAIGIREPAPGAYGACLHVIDRWQHLGTARDDEEVETLLRSTSRRVFDADSYRIIRRCLKTLRSRDIVVFDRAGK